MSKKTTGTARMIPIALTALSVAIAFIAVPAFAQADKLADLLAKTDLVYDTLNENLYLLPFETEDEGTINVLVTYSNEEKQFLLIFTTVLDYEDYHGYKSETLAAALRISNDHQAIKMCLDIENGDIDCQVEPYLRILDAEALDMYINLVVGIAAQYKEELSNLEEGLPVG
jgi:hypothetical protein